MRRWGVLISGRGSNLGALIDARATCGDSFFDLRLVLSSSPLASGLLRARRAGIPTDLIPYAAGTKKIDWVALDRRLRKEGVTHLFLAGFMKIVPASFVENWRGRILNLHPSLLPLYPGLGSIEKAYSDGAPMGLTVHEVNEEVDAGQIVLQRVTTGKDQSRDRSLETAEFYVHIDEQRAVKEAVEKWRT
jgi:phosphoribosylglycinamide formyltransferase 1